MPGVREVADADARPSLTARWAAKVGRTPAPLGHRRRAGDDPAGAADARHAHLAAGPVHPVVRPDHPQGLRPGHRRVRRRLHRPVRVRRRPRPGERLRHPGAGDGARRPRRHRRGHRAGRLPRRRDRRPSTRSRRSARPTSAAPTWSSPSGPRCPTASRSPATRRCSPTSSELLAGRLWLVIAFVVGVSILLLAMMFRSVVVPIKAAVMNLLSIAAAYGVMVAVFQWGWGTELLGLDHAVPVSSWVPILMFAILFGLSMDYEVFLLSRIREDWESTGDPRGSVVRGLAVHRPGHLQRRRDHGRRLPRLRDRGRRGRQDARRRHGGGDPARRHRGPDGPGAGDHVAARPLELVGARAGSTGCCPASAPRSPTRTSVCSPPPTSDDVRRARARRRPLRGSGHDDHIHAAWPEQIRLPGQAAAHPGPVDMTMMYLMHHAFRRDLAGFAAAAGTTPVADRESWQALAERWELFSFALHHHHTGEDDGLWPALLDRADEPGQGGAGGDGGRARGDRPDPGGLRRRVRPARRPRRRGRPLRPRRAAGRGPGTARRPPPARGDRGDRADPGSCSRRRSGRRSRRSTSPRASRSATSSPWCRGRCTRCPARSGASCSPRPGPCTG